MIPVLLAAWSGVGKVLRTVPPWAWVAFAALFAAYLYGEARADAREAEIRGQYEAQAAVDAQQAAEFLAEETQRNRLAEQALNDQLHQAAIDHAQALNDLEARTDRTVADLRAGNQRVRQQWAACLSRPGPTAQAGPGHAGPADDGIASAGRILRIAGECDAAVKRWQDTWNAAEKAVNGEQHAIATP